MDYSDFISNLMNNKYLIYQENEYSKRNKKQVTNEIVEVDGKQLLSTYVKRDKSIFLFIDTCVWLNMAQKGDFDNLIRIADLTTQRDALLIVPEQLKVEWDRNKQEKIVENEKKNIEELIKKTTSFRDNILKEEDHKSKLTEYIRIAEEMKIEQTEYISAHTLAIYDEVLDLGYSVKTTDEIKINAVDFALEKKAPFHLNKNSMGDTILFLSCIEYLNLEDFKENANRILYFVTENKSDFSDKSSPLEMHPDLLEYASSCGITIKYSLNLKATLDEIFSEVTDEAYVECYKERYESQFRRCPNCNGKLLYKKHQWDGRGNKTFFECENTVCSYREETGEYFQDQVIDAIY